MTCDESRQSHYLFREPISFVLKAQIGRELKDGMMMLSRMGMKYILLFFEGFLFGKSSVPWVQIYQILRNRPVYLSL